MPIRTRLTDEEVARFAAQRYRFPGVEIKARLFRNYPHGELARHVLGYIGRINQREKKPRWKTGPRKSQANYRGTDYIGKLGVEQSYEKTLHGLTGVEQMETSAGGRAVRKLASNPATPGNTVMLSIDIKLQKLIEDMFGERRGALVAIEPSTGEVLAFVSKPTFDPNLFVEGIDQRKLGRAERIDRQAAAQPRAARHLPAGLHLQALHGAGRAADSASASRATVINDPGFYTFGGHTLPQPRGRAWAASTCTARSSAFEQHVLLLAGQRHGRGRDPRLHEAARLRPDHRHRHRAARCAACCPAPSGSARPTSGRSMKKWYAGETISLGIGQGYNTFTMLQLATRHRHAGQRRHQVQAAPGAGHQGHGDRRRWCAPSRCRPRT